MLLQACLLAAWCARIGTAHAQGEVLSLDPAAFVRWPEAGHATALARDARGFLWVGSTEGLARFDGISFREVPLPIAGMTVSALAIDDAGDVWIGTRHHASAGLFRLHAGRVERLPLAAASARVEVVALAVNHAGAVFIGSSDGLYRWSQGQSVRLGPEHGLPDAPVHALAIREDAIFVATAAGLFRGDGERFAAVAAGPVTALHVSRKGELFYAAQTAGEQAGIYQFDADDGARPVASPLPGPVSGIAEAGDGLWIATARGAYRHDGETLSPVRLEGFSDNMRVEAVLLDGSSNVWLATEWDGLIGVPSRPPLRIHRKLEAGGDGTSFAVAADRMGAVWASMGSRLLRWRNGQWDSFSPPSSIQVYVMRGLSVGPEGTVWVSTLTHGVYSFDGETFQLWSTTNGLPSNDVTAVFHDRQGRLWLGLGGGGLARRDEGRFALVEGAQAACPGAQVAIEEDATGAIWSGGPEGLCRWSAGVFTRVTIAEGLPESDVRSLHVDAEGTLWIGMATAGVAVFDRERIRTVPGALRVGAGHVGQVLSDGAGFIWLASWTGLFRFAREGLLADSAAGMLHFDVRDGLPSASFMSAFNPGGVRAGNGSLWFACHRSIVEVPDPGRVAPTALPNIVVDKFAVNGTPLPIARPVRVPVGTGTLEIEYSAPAPLGARHLVFSHQLRGFEGDWQLASKQRIVRYTNLPAGDYTFLMSVRSADGHAENQAAVMLTLIAPFYKSHAFVIACGLFLLVAVSFAHRVRVWQLQRRFQTISDERTRIARDMHDTLEQSLVGVKLQVEAMEDHLHAPAILRTDLQRTGDLIARSVRELQNSIWALRNPNTGAVPLPTALAVMAGRALRGLDVAFALETEGEPQPLPVDTQQQVVCIIQEGLTNALKHAQPRGIVLSLRQSDDGLTVCLQDDGAGFLPGQRPGPESGHFGLLGMKERARALGATLEISSAPGTGTRLSLVVPLAQAKKAGPT